MVRRLIIAAGLVLTLPQAVLCQVEWQLSSAPLWSIGEEAAPSPKVFHDVRGALLIGDTLVVVADGSSHHLRIFDRDGGFVRSFGDYGDGPGEFRRIAWIGMCGGATVVVYDELRWRVTKWSLQGQLLADFPIEGAGDGRPPYSVSCGPDGRYAVTGWPDIEAASATVGPYRPGVSVSVAGVSGHTEKAIGTFPGPERYRFPTNDGPRRLGRTTIVRMDRHAVYVGTGDSTFIHILRADGSQARLIKREERIRLTSSMLDRYKAWVVARQPPDFRPAARRALDAMEFPDFLPAYDDFRIDDSGHVWVARYALPNDHALQPAVWDVFDRGGSQVAIVRLPSHFTLASIGEDYLLGVSTDPLDIERVTLYGLARGGRQPAHPHSHTGPEAR